MKTHQFLLLSLCVILFFTRCNHDDLEPVVFKQINGIKLSGTKLTADAVFHNPNNKEMRLKKIKMDISVDEKKTATIDQNLDIMIPAKSNFSVPVEAQMSLKDLGLADAIFSVLGGKKLQIRFKGRIRGNYKGVPVIIPIDYKSELKINL